MKTKIHCILLILKMLSAILNAIPIREKIVLRITVYAIVCPSKWQAVKAETMPVEPLPSTSAAPPEPNTGFEPHLYVT